MAARASGAAYGFQHVHAALQTGHVLPECQAKQVLERQTKLNSGIRELRTASAFAAGSGKPRHALVQPNVLTQ